MCLTLIGNSTLRTCDSLTRHAFPPSRQDDDGSTLQRRWNSLVGDVPRSRGGWLNYRASSWLEPICSIGGVGEPRQGRTQARRRSDGRTQLIIPSRTPCNRPASCPEIQEANVAEVGKKERKNEREGSDVIFARRNPANGTPEASLSNRRVAKSRRVNVFDDARSTVATKESRSRSHLRKSVSIYRAIAYTCSEHRVTLPEVNKVHTPASQFFLRLCFSTRFSAFSHLRPVTATSSLSSCFS